MPDQRVYVEKPKKNNKNQRTVIITFKTPADERNFFARGKNTRPGKLTVTDTVGKKVFMNYKKLGK